MESRSYNFSTAKKRSTQMEIIASFPREDDAAPRTNILKKECPDQLLRFKECVDRTKDESKCSQFKDEMIECGRPAFRKANTTVGYEF